MHAFDYSAANRVNTAETTQACPSAARATMNPRCPIRGRSALANVLRVRHFTAYLAHGHAKNPVTNLCTSYNRIPKWTKICRSTLQVRQRYQYRNEPLIYDNGWALMASCVVALQKSAVL
jgi:hypothetical protein